MSFNLNAVTHLFSRVERTRENMHLYQSIDAYEFLVANPFSGLFIDLGLGKTICSLTVIVDLIMNFDLDQNEKILVIGPRRVVLETWPDEIAAWEHTAGLSFQVIYAHDDDPRLDVVQKAAESASRAISLAQGLSPLARQSAAAKAGQKARTAEKERIRREQARSNASVHLISRDDVEWLTERWGRKWPYRTVFIDESSGFKDHASKRFQALQAVRNAEENLITRLHILTATPAAETYEHLFPQIWLLDKGKRLGVNITTYRKKYFSQNIYSRKWELRPDAEHEIIEKISDICLVMKAEDYLNIEKPVIVPRPVYLGAAELAVYKQMQNDMLVTMPDGTQIEAETAAALSQKLLQIASGVLYETANFLDDATAEVVKVKKVHSIHDKKIEALQQIIEEAQGQPIMVAYHFKSSLDRLKKAFPQGRAMDREGKAIKPWNAGKIPLLFIHPMSAGHGLNMQKGGHHIVFFDIPWSLENFIQLIGRLARQGQKNIVVVQLLLAMETLDWRVWQQLSKKEDAQDMLFRLLRRAIAKRKKERQEAQQGLEFAC